MFQSPGDVAFSFLGFSVYYYGIILAVAIFIGVYTSYLLYEKFYDSVNAKKILDFATLIIIIGIVGARLYYCVVNYSYYLQHPAEVFYIRQGGFSMPMRKGYADKVFIITSGENMAIHAGANIAMAVENFKNRGYASLGGIILNRRNVAREEEKVNELADDFQTQVVGTLSHSGLVTEAEEKKETVMECFPDSEMAEEYRKLAEAIYELSKRPEGSACEKANEKYTADKRPGEGLKC